MFDLSWGTERLPYVIVMRNTILSFLKIARSLDLDSHKLFTFWLFIVLSTISTGLSAQEEWEEVDASKLSWKISNNLTVHSRKLSYLSVANTIAETKENKKNIVGTMKMQHFT